MKPLAIIGLDPGTTSAYAAIDLQGNIIKINFSKEMPLSEVIQQITEICLPIVVSTDKAKAPSFVEEFSRKTGAKLVFPEEDLKKEEKRNLTGGIYQETKNDHEHDALSAALFAYRKYLPKLEKINRFIESSHLESKRNEFTKLALLEDFNFYLIKDILTRENKERDKEESTEHIIIKEAATENKITKKNFLVLYQKLSLLKKEKEHLENRIKKLNQELKLTRKTNQLLDRRAYNFDQRIDLLLKFKEDRMHLQNDEIKKQNDQIRELKEDINSLFSFIEKTSDYLLLKKLNSLSYDEFTRKNKILNIKENDFLLVENTNIFSEKVVQELGGKGMVLISLGKISKKIKEIFRTAVIKEIVLENDYFALVEEASIKFEDNDLIGKIVGEYREKRGLK